MTELEIVDEIAAMSDIEFAELICDLVNKKWDELSKYMREALLVSRRIVMCNQSNIGEYKCSVPIICSPQSGIKSIAVDLCLQDEVFDLIKNKGVLTVGSCCGHGKKRAFIQVTDYSVDKMLALGYDKLPVDLYGNGENCFAPKTKL